jgi:hypothetical protein
MSNLFRLSRRYGIALFLFLFCCIVCGAQEPGLTRRPDGEKRELVSPPPFPMKVPEKLEPAHAPNNNITYQALRQRTVNGEAFTVSHLSLKRDAGEFMLTSGTIYLYGPVNGLVYGRGVYRRGHAAYRTALRDGAEELKAVMKTEVLDQRFTSAVMSFTDGTAAELKKGSTGTATGWGCGVWARGGGADACFAGI